MSRQFSIRVQWILPPGHPDRVGNLDTPSVVSLWSRSRLNAKSAWRSWRLLDSPFAPTGHNCHSQAERHEAMSELYRLQLIEMAHDQLDDPEATPGAIMAAAVEIDAEIKATAQDRGIEHIRLPGASRTELDTAGDLAAQGVRVPGLLTTTHELNEDGSLKDPSKQPTDEVGNELEGMD